MHTENMKCVLCGLTAPGHGACTHVWLIYLVTFHWRKMIFLHHNYQ